VFAILKKDSGRLPLLDNPEVKSGVKSTGADGKKQKWLADVRFFSIATFFGVERVLVQNMRQ